MSESNAPFQRPDRSKAARSTNAKSASAKSANAKSAETSSNPFIEALQEVNAAEESVCQQKEQHLGEVANISSVGNVQFDDSQVEEVSASIPFVSTPIEPTSIDHPPSSPSDPTTLPPDAATWINSSQPADLADLISLIQELNQCNSILLDRVSQLEEALERSQTALKSEMSRSSTVPPLPDFVPEGLVTIRDLNEAQTQITDLYGQLESVHQASQRQQIVVETLTCQLEASQERVAHLEREAALIQQRCNEQAQLLTQSENHCRDLQARLHRQQRYTLQFKAALEKSLEVSTPQYLSVEEAVAAVNVESLLPKVQNIRPWSSANEAGNIHSSWMKLSAMPIADETLLEEETTTAANESDWANPFAPSAPQPSKFAHVKLPGFIEEAWQSTPDVPVAEEAPVEAIGSQPAVSYNLRSADAASVELPAELSNERLMQKLDEVVQPLADMLAQAMLKDTAQPESVHSADLPNETSRTGTGMVSEISNAPSAELVKSETSPDALLNSVMADAEDALWQDLARLIDVSSEDVMKAMSGDVSAFESINFEPNNFDAQPTAQSHQSVEQVAMVAPSSRTKPSNQELNDCSPHQVPASHPTAVEDFELEMAQAVKSVSATPSEQTIADPNLSNPGWPSPLVYPLRPTKKRRSLAAVELPTFLHQEPGVMPT